MKRILPIFIILFSMTSLAQQTEINNISKRTEIMIKAVRQNFLTNPILADSFCDSIIKLNDSFFLGEAKRTKAEIQLARMNYSNTLLLVNEAIKIDSTNNNSVQLAKDYFIKGMYFHLLVKRDEALLLFEKADSLTKGTQEYKFKGLLLKYIALIYETNNKVEAIKTLKRAKEFSLKAKDSFNLYNIENTESTLLKKTLKNHRGNQKLYNYSIKTNNPYYIAWSQLGIGNSYGSSKNIDTILIAKKHLDSAVVFFEKNKYNFLAQIAYTRLSSIARKSKNTDLSLEYILKSYEAVKNSDSFLKEMTMYNLAYNYLLNKEFLKAENLFNDVIELDKTKDMQQILIAYSYEGLSDIYAIRKKPIKALQYYKKYTKVNDKLYSTQIAEQVTNFKIKYETQKKEKENLQLKADNVEQELLTQKANSQKWMLALGLLAVALLSFILWRRYTSEKKEKQIITIQKDEIGVQKTIIENLQKDLHHRVKNNLTIIDSLIEDIKNEFDNKAFTSKLTDLQNRIDSINEVHSQLYMNTDITNLKLNKYVEKLAKNVQQSFAKENIIIKQNIHDSLSLKVDKSFPVGLVINEFITNSFKYAFPNNEKGIVNISIQEKSDNYILSLSDNGKGLDKDFDISKLDSFGMDIMRLLSKQLQGTFSLDGARGVHIIIKFPKA